SYALSWKSCQEDCLNLPDHRYSIYTVKRSYGIGGTNNGVAASFQLNPSSDSKLQGRLLASFQDDAKYEHVGQDTISQDGKDYKDKQGKDLNISEQKTNSKDNDKGSRSKNTKHVGTSIQNNKDQRFKNSTTKQSQEVQGSKI
ncbi:hypothetical protein Tco_0111278, partial [Tanacetum coccineum]